jgi:predicted  nucleic acid-binding Zn-ribbon protein
MQDTSVAGKELKQTIEQLYTKLDLLKMSDEGGVLSENIQYYGIDDLMIDLSIYSKNLIACVSALEEEISDLEDDVEDLEDDKRELEDRVEELENELDDAGCDCESDAKHLILESLADNMKMEFIASVFAEFTLEQLEERLKL